MSGMHKITPAFSQPLHSVAVTREIMLDAQASLPTQTLMKRAGVAIARLTMALAPHAQCIWVACGPGNSGGNGLEAAAHLQGWAQPQGKRVVVTWTSQSDGTHNPPEDARTAHAKALVAGVVVSTQVPDEFDFCIDALLDFGTRLDDNRPTWALIVNWLGLMRASQAPCLAVDVPTGLDADTGAATDLNALLLTASPTIRQKASARFTLSLLTLKPGLFTSQGRDMAGEVWLDDLGVAAQGYRPTATLLGADHARQFARTMSVQDSHKGTFGDVAVLGGQSTSNNHMTGAALLAARAALHAGAGRVLVTLLGNAETLLQVDPLQPELMFRNFEALNFSHQTTVCGCGGGQAVKALLPEVLAQSQTLVLDADALNAIASEPHLKVDLKARGGTRMEAKNTGRPAKRTVLTPHPLEAARLMGSTAASVQENRLAAAQALADLFDAVVVLKGSGTVIAAPHMTPCINASGNALLATAGTGDVLAGMIGACLARGLSAWDAARSAVFAHGLLADEWAVNRPGQVLTASALACAPSTEGKICTARSVH